MLLLLVAVLQEGPLCCGLRAAASGTGSRVAVLQVGPAAGAGMQEEVLQHAAGSHQLQLPQQQVAVA